ncbi:hypothetical protein O4H52_03175 [Sphingomonadaceae bacterium G21617-S1]|nr:hypothetical protein [Sphingomonadaceae bacterium G21617-S1]
MILADGHAAIAQCDSCGDRAEAIEERNRRTGALTAAFLPEGWQLDKVEGEPVHRCALCVAASEKPFEDRREAFEARLEQLGAALTVDIAASLGVPIALARRWAGEWRSVQADQLGHILQRDRHGAARPGAGAVVLQADDVGDVAGARVGQLGLPHAVDARERGQRGRLDQGGDHHINSNGNRGRWHGAMMRDQGGASNRGKK